MEEDRGGRSIAGSSLRSQAAIPRKPYDSAVASIEHQVAQLDEQLDALQGRLSPYRFSQPIREAAGRADDREGHSDAVTNLESLAGRLRGLNARVHGLLEELEL